MERGSKERLEKHNQLESDIEKAINQEGVDILMAQSALQIVLQRIEESIKDFLASKETKEVLYDENTTE